VLVYDVNDPQSFDHAVGRWLDDVKAHTDEADHVAMLEGSILLGNKSGTRAHCWLSPEPASISQPFREK